MMCCGWNPPNHSETEEWSIGFASDRNLLSVSLRIIRNDPTETFTKKNFKQSGFV